MSGDTSSAPSSPSDETLRRSRQYLLGLLPMPERDAFEVDLLRSPALLEATEAAEEALLQDYVHGRLTGEERRRADEHFLDDSRRAEISMRRTILSHTPRGSERPSAAAVRPRPWWGRSDFVVAASVALVVGATAGWVASSRWPRGPSVRIVDVNPAGARDQGGATELTAPAEREWMRLRVPLAPGASIDDVFRVELRAAAADPASSLWVRDAVAEPDAGGLWVAVDVPGRVLTSGTYFVRVGRRAGQALEPVVDAAIVVR